MCYFIFCHAVCNRSICPLFINFINNLTSFIFQLNNMSHRLSMNSSFSSTSSNRLCSNISRPPSGCRTPTVSFRTSSRLSARVSPRPSPRPSPRLRRSHSYCSRRSSWKSKKGKDEERAKLVKQNSNNEERDDESDFCDFDEDGDDEVFKPALSHPILKTPENAAKRYGRKS